MVLPMQVALLAAEKRPHCRSRRRRILNSLRMQLLNDKSGPPATPAAAGLAAMPRQTGVMLRFGTRGGAAAAAGTIRSVRAAHIGPTNVRMICFPDRGERESRPDVNGLRVPQFLKHRRRKPG